MVLFPLLLLLCLPHSFLAKEVEVTDEWAILGENDTVPAGMHIRMNLETGEKWVKQLSDDDSESSSQPQEHQAHVVTADGGVVVVVPDDETTSTTTDETTTTTTRTPQKQHGDYDYAMMHRTLSKLPEDEQEKMNLPQLPGGTTASLSADERRDFERRMKEIWEARQRELRDLEVADLPKILKDRIKRLQSYLENPIPELRDLLLSEDDPHDENVVTHIVSVLQDLEYHLSDVDMARDFVTLGGWPLLVRLLVGPTVYVAHNKNATTTTATTDTALWSNYDLAQVVHRVQAHAAWAMGTAVKNTAEFAPLALQPVVLDDGTFTTAVDWLLQQYTSATTKTTTALAQRNHKLLYALSALLRGNRPAQAHFAGAHGPALLGDQLAQALLNFEKNNNKKTIQRLLSLAHDLVTEVRLQPGKSAQVDAVLVDSFATNVWCSSAVDALVVVPETALTTLQSLGVHCHDKAAVQSALRAWKDSNEQTTELLDLVDSVLDVF